MLREAHYAAVLAIPNSTFDCPSRAACYNAGPCMSGNFDRLASRIEPFSTDGKFLPQRQSPTLICNFLKWYGSMFLVHALGEIRFHDSGHLAILWKP